MGRWVAKFLWAIAHLPTLVAEALRRANTKPVAIFLWVVLQPLQWLSLRTGHAVFGFKRCNDRHARFEFSNDGHFPFFSDLSFGLAMNVTQIADDNVGAPAQALSTIMKAGFKQITLRNMRRREPTDDGSEPYASRVTVEPQS